MSEYPQEEAEHPLAFEAFATPPQPGPVLPGPLPAAYPQPTPQTAAFEPHVFPTQQPGPAGPYTERPAAAAPAAVQMPETPATFEQFTAATAATATPSPAKWGWRGRVRTLTGGLVSPAMGSEEAAHRRALDQIQAGFSGPRTIVLVNPKGGATTTTSTLLASRTFGVHRGGGVIAWDNNETRGTLGQRARSAAQVNTARELLDNINVFADSATARIGDLGLYVRGQGGAHFDVLASDERPEVTGHIASTDVDRLHQLLQRFYKLILIDTGNNMRAPNWLTAVHSADLLVVTTTVRQDTAGAALWMLDALEKQVYGLGQLKHRSITLLTEPSPDTDPALKRMIVNTFGARTRGVYQIPYDPALVDGGVVNYDWLSPATHRSWLFACAAMAQAIQTPTH
ncbi:MinD/ParA family protein [Streptomyces sp. NPDC020800]|uniref:MinD/ParA family protein n=1 Tax=Streptomyces sp. NPDC020800 TaxID=3365092 RepID=UPI0037B275AD